MGLLGHLRWLKQVLASEFYTCCNFQAAEAAILLQKGMEKNQRRSKVAGIQGLYRLLSERIDADVLDAPESTVSTMSVGYDHVSLEELKKTGTRLGYTPEVLTEAAAELTVALLLATSCQLLEAVDEAKVSGWGSWKPLWMCGYGLTDSTMGILGLGCIDELQQRTAVAMHLKPFGVRKFLYINTAPQPKMAAAIPTEFVPLEEMARCSDFITVCCMLSPGSQSICNSSMFSQMKDTTIFSNRSRGSVVNQDDLYQALASGHIAAAGLDVMVPEPLPTDHPLFKFKNCGVCCKLLLFLLSFNPLPAHRNRAGRQICSGCDLQETSTSYKHSR
uniref:Glyoxylate reductase/hydroxypyruvate reductase n=1 Tax=Dromaius novaehollandiae TaxID=8790 RepID=A0A8C4KMV7_DRONO